LKIRPILHGYPNGVKLSGLASLRFETENVLAMDFFAQLLNGLLQGVFL